MSTDSTRYERRMCTRCTGTGRARCPNCAGTGEFVVVGGMEALPPSPADQAHDVVRVTGTMWARIREIVDSGIPYREHVARSQQVALEHAAREVRARDDQWIAAAIVAYAALATLATLLTIATALA